jgi:epoxyqueuosine reductase
MAKRDKHSPRRNGELSHLTGDALSRHVASLIESKSFAAVGFVTAEPSRWGPYFRGWLESGCHGTMKYLENDLELRDTPAKVWDGTKSFIVVADQYAARGDVHPSRLGEARPMGRVARYAQGGNYHFEMKKRLHAVADRLRAEFPGTAFRSCVDTVPIFERELAALAGLGWQGRNTMLIHPRLGSYLLLGVVATTLDLPPLEGQRVVSDHCGTCTRCIDACPTQAITPYRVDASRCVSYLTIEHREAIDPKFHAAMGDWMYGCDICQDVCPHNSPRPGMESPQIPSAYEPRSKWLDVLEVLAWTSEQRQEAFRASPMKRANLAMMQRNAAIVAANAAAGPDGGKIRAALAAQREHASGLLRTTLDQVLGEAEPTGNVSG